MNFVASRRAIAFFLGLSVAGSALSASDLTDEQILTLFSSTSMFSTGADAPKTVPKQAVECVRLLSGLDDAIFKDMPQDAVGQLKTGCRRELASRLDDKALNPVGLTLEHVETAEFAERLSAVRARAQEGAKAHAALESERRKAERARHEEQRLREMADALDIVRAQLAAIKAELPKALDEAASVCGMFDSEKEALRKRDGRSPVLNRAWRPHICQASYAERAGRQLERIEQAIGAMVVKDGAPTLRPGMPALGEADPARIRGEINSMQAVIADMKSA